VYQNLKAGGYLFVLAGMLGAAGCSAMLPWPEPGGVEPPIRFLLTFDDGPSTAETDNPTVRVLETLRDNPLQPEIRAIFFVQTRTPRAGGSPVGQQLIQQARAEGHVLALHCASPQGHRNHRSLGADLLAESLAAGRADLVAYAGESTELVRPPYWAFDPTTLTIYDQSEMAMLLTDVRARDGAHWLFPANALKARDLRRDLEHFRRRVRAGHIREVDGVVPVVITFHDVNPHTARRLGTHLEALLQTAEAMGLDVADPPFYSDRESLLRAARTRATNHATRADLPP
jgi:peptidoglycan/xylan/chitin deacetylase (PgdA/CDA1 family)